MWPDVSGAFTVVEIAFNVYSRMSMDVRVASLRMKFFYNEKRVDVSCTRFRIPSSWWRLARLFIVSQGDPSSRGMNLSVLSAFRSHIQTSADPS